MINGIKPVLVEVRVDDTFLLVPRTTKLTTNDNTLRLETIEETKVLEFKSKDAAVKGLIIIASALRDTTKHGVLLTSDGEKLIDYKCGW